MFCDRAWKIIQSLSSFDWVSLSLHKARAVAASRVAYRLSLVMITCSRPREQPSACLLPPLLLH